MLNQISQLPQLVLSLSGDFENQWIIKINHSAGSGPDQFGKFIKAETIKWAKIVKSSGARAN
jgi:hypothetical protein